MPQQIENQRIEIQQFLDSQLLVFGISKQNVLDSNMSSCCKNFEAKMFAAEKMKMENDSLHTTMKDFIKAQLDSISGLQMSQKSLPPLPRKSSFSNPQAPLKSVKIKEKSKKTPKKLHIKVPKKTNIFHSKSGFGFKSAEESPQFFISRSIESTPHTDSPAGVSDYTRSPDSLEKNPHPIPRKKSILKSISMVKNALGIKSAKPPATPKFSNPIKLSKNPPPRRPPIEPPKLSQILREEEESTSFSGNLGESFTATTYDSDEVTDLEDSEPQKFKSEIQPSDFKQEKNIHIEDIIQEQESLRLNTEIKHNVLHNINRKEDDIHIEEIVQDFVSEEESAENINNTLTSLSPIRTAIEEESARDEQIIQNTDDINEFDSESLSLTDISNSIREKPSPSSPGADILRDL